MIMQIELPITCNQLKYGLYLLACCLFVVGMVGHDDDNYACRGTVGDSSCGFTSWYGGMMELFKVVGATSMFIGGIMILIDLHTRGKLPEFSINCRCDK